MPCDGSDDAAAVQWQVNFEGHDLQKSKQILCVDLSQEKKVFGTQRAEIRFIFHMVQKVANDLEASGCSGVMPCDGLSELLCAEVTAIRFSSASFFLGKRSRS